MHMPVNDVCIIIYYMYGMLLYIDWSDFGWGGLCPQNSLPRLEWITHGYVHIGQYRLACC